MTLKDNMYQINLEPFLYDSKTVRDVSFEPVPLSTHLSKRSQTVPDDILVEPNQNLLQVTIEDRAIIFDLDRYSQVITDGKSKAFSAVRDYSNLRQLLDPERFVCSEFNVQSCYSLPSTETALLKVCAKAETNRTRSFFLLRNVTRRTASSQDQ